MRYTVWMTKEEKQKTLRAVKGGDTKLENNSIAAMTSRALGMGHMAEVWGALVPGASMGGTRSNVAIAVNNAPVAISALRKAGKYSDDNQLHSLNNRYFAFDDSDGVADAPTETTFTPTDYFPKGKAKTWPMLVLTTNHATARDLDDLGVIMHGWERLYQDAMPESAPDVKVISTLFTRENRELNGANLLQRLHNIKETDETSVRNLQGISPDSVQLGNMILSLLIEKPDMINISGDEGRTDTYENAYDLPPLCKKEPSHEQTLVLRSDAAEVASHIRLAGYSRGGGAVTDAMRYVARQLVPSARDKTSDEKPFPTFKIRDAKTKRIRPLDKADKDAKAILSHMPLLSVAPWETTLTEREADIGIRRLTLLNTYDELATRFFLKYNRKDVHSPDEDKLEMVDGVMGARAHNPREALLGPCDESGKPSGEPGYFADNAQAKAAIEELFSPAIEKSQKRTR